MISPLIRSATTADIAAIAAIDFATNEGQPFAIPWAKPEDGLLMFKKRFEFYFTQPTFHFLVAEAQGAIVGFLAWKVPGKGEEEEWIPDFPEGTNVEFLEWYLEGIKEDADGLGVGDLYGRGFAFFPFLFCILYNCFGTLPVNAMLGIG